jgi:hypothetical protein
MVEGGQACPQIFDRFQLLVEPCDFSFDQAQLAVDASALIN